MYMFMCNLWLPMHSRIALRPQDAPEQTQNAIAYQGVPGAYSEVAALATCPGWTHVPCNQFEQVFQVGRDRKILLQAGLSLRRAGSAVTWKLLFACGALVE
jgi:hypothetical protein